MSNGTTIANQIGARLSLRKPQSESLAILCRLLEQLKLEKEPDLQHWIDRKRPAKAVLTGATGYSAGRATRQGSSSLTRFTGQSAITFSTCRR